MTPEYIGVLLDYNYWARDRVLASAEPLSAELNRVVEYKTMSGQSSASPYWQMIVHVMNHGTYHRGQIATMLRQLGAKPAMSTDMIAFFREQSAGAR